MTHKKEMENQIGYRLESIELRNGSRFEGIAQSRKPRETSQVVGYRWSTPGRRACCAKDEKMNNRGRNLILARFDLEEEC